MAQLFSPAIGLATLLAATLMGTPLDAQDKYPLRTVKIVQTVPAGSSPDIRSRIIAEQLTRIWGKQVVVETDRAAAG